MKVLITGISGFVGQNLSAVLQAAGHQVSGLDIRQRDNIQAETGPDLANDNVTTALVARMEHDVVIHLASSVSTPGSLDRPMETFRNTVRTGVNIIEACRQTETPLIVTSSVKARDPVSTPYGVSKRMVELWAQDYITAYGTKCIINRPGTIYGPGQEGSAESGWIAWFLKAKREKLPITVHRPGTQIRDLLHVQDYCRLLLMQMINWDAFNGKIWDVGGGWDNAVTVLEMADFLGLDWTFGPERYGDDLEYVGYNATPGWKPTIRWKEAEVFNE